MHSEHQHLSKYIKGPSNVEEPPHIFFNQELMVAGNSQAGTCNKGKMSKPCKSEK